MPKRTAVNSIFVVRDGKQIQVKPGTTFEFTAEELADIKANSPESVRTPNGPEQTDAEREQAEAQAAAEADAQRVKDEEAAAKKRADDKAAADKTAADKKAADKKASATKSADDI